MSGDLKDPARSLPLGTFLAVGLSTIVYVIAMFALAASVPLQGLASDFDSMRRIAAAPWLIDAGVLSATLSSALASFLGAPRILQALASDGLFDRLTFFAAGHGPTGNPRRGVVLTAIISVVTIGLGDLNTIAALVSMFFLVSYGLLNYATYVEAVGDSPSFRPRFRFFHARRQPGRYRAVWPRHADGRPDGKRRGPRRPRGALPLPAVVRRPVSLA